MDRCSDWIICWHRRVEPESSRPPTRDMDVQEPPWVSNGRSFPNTRQHVRRCPCKGSLCVREDIGERVRTQGIDDDWVCRVSGSIQLLLEGIYWPFCSSHRWDPQKKEWVKAEKPQLITQDDTPHPHVPRSVQPRSTEPGLKNVGRLFQESWFLVGPETHLCLDSFTAVICAMISPLLSLPWLCRLDHDCHCFWS